MRGGRGGRGGTPRADTPYKLATAGVKGCRPATFSLKLNKNTANAANGDNWYKMSEAQASGMEDKGTQSETEEAPNTETSSVV